jgi:hypothetical protein
MRAMLMKGLIQRQPHHKKLETIGSRISEIDGVVQARVHPVMESRLERVRLQFEIFHISTHGLATCLRPRLHIAGSIIFKMAHSSIEKREE